MSQVNELLDIFRERPLGVEDAEISEARLRRIVPELEAFTQRVVQERKERRRWGRNVLLLASLVAGTGIGVMVTSGFEFTDPGLRVTGEVTHLDGQGGRTLVAGDVELSLVGQVETHAVGARIATREGLTLELAPESRVVLGRLGASVKNQRVELNAGSVKCQVPSMGEHRAFSVVTPDATVVVHGTTLSVEVRPTPEGQSRTCVRVSEGLVSVHGKNQISLVSAGQQLGCEPVQPVGAAPVEEGDERLAEQVESGHAGDATESGNVPAGTARRSGQRSPEAPAQGTLAQETRLLQRALRAEREGRPGEARQHAAALLAKHPDSPLAEEARVILRRIDARQE